LFNDLFCGLSTRSAVQSIAGQVVNLPWPAASHIAMGCLLFSLVYATRVVALSFSPGLDALFFFFSPFCSGPFTVSGFAPEARGGVNVGRVLFRPAEKVFSSRFFFIPGVVGGIFFFFRPFFSLRFFSFPGASLSGSCFFQWTPFCF